MTVEVMRTGNHVSVNRDGSPVGHAVQLKGAERWTAFVYIKAPPFDTTRTGFASADEAADFIARNGVTPDHLSASWSDPEEQS